MQWFGSAPPSFEGINRPALNGGAGESACVRPWPNTILRDVIVRHRNAPAAIHHATANAPLPRPALKYRIGPIPFATKTNRQASDPTATKTDDYHDMVR